MKYIIHIIAVFVVFLSLSGINTSYAEDKEEEKKITIEKTEVLGVLERPAVVFPVRWKSPEGHQAKSVTLMRSFKEEIFEFIDMKTISQEGRWK